MYTKIKQALSSLVNYLTSYFPTQLAVGMTEYEAWLASVIALTGPIADEQSMAWVISNEIMRLSPGRDRVPKRVFVKALRKYAANQIAAAKVMAIKEAQKNQAEATAQPQAAASGQAT